jgi:hypothetical protein
LIPAALFVATGLMIGSPAAPPATAEVAPQAQEILLEIRMGRLDRKVVPALSLEGSIHLPGPELLGLAEIAFESLPSGSLRGVRHPGNRNFSVEAASGRITFEGRPLPGPAIVFEGRTYLPVAAWEALLDSPIEIDWTELTAWIREPGHLPVGLRHAREARWGNASPGHPGVRRPSDLVLPPTRYRVGGGVLDWSVSSTLGDPTETAAASILVGAQLLGGGVQVSSRSLGPVSGGSFRTGASYHRTWGGEGLAPRQLRLGDGISTGPRPRSLRGVHLTNAPRVRESFFAIETLGGRLGPGWDVEVRQQGRLVDVRRADEQGAWALDIPLVYGFNPVQVVGYGPHGEVVTMERLLLLRNDRMRPGAFEWGVSGGQCLDSGRCDRAANLDLRYGLSSRWTVRAGAEAAHTDTLGAIVIPYVEALGNPFHALGISAETLIGSLARGTATLTPSPNLRLRGAYTRFADDPETAVFHDARRRSTVEADLFLRPVPSWSRLSGNVSFVREAFTPWTSSRTRALGVYDAPRRRYEAGVELRHMEVAGAEAEVRPLAAITGTGAGRSWYRAEVEFDRAGDLHRAFLRVATPMLGRHRVDLGARWSRLSGSEFVLGFSADFGGLRSTSQLTATPEGVGQGYQYVQGTVLWDEASARVRAGNAPRVERSGVAGVVFLDENGNGRRDPDEPGLAGIRVVVEGRSVTTDEDGHYYLDDLVPWEPTRVSVAAGSLPHPLWIPALESIDVPLAPSSVRRVDLGVVRGGEVRGRVVRTGPDGRELPVAGVPMLLVDLQRPGRMVEITTFSDGAFYAMGIPPGGYELRVTPGSLRGLDLEADFPRRAVIIDPAGGNGGREIIIRLVNPPLPSPGRP